MRSGLSNSILDAIGNTPMLEVEGIYCKLEYLNPSGSIKARIAKYVVERAAQRGEVRLEAITPRVASLPTDLVRHELLLTHAPVPEATNVEIVDDIFLPLVRARSESA